MKKEYRWEEKFDGYYNSLGLDHVVSFGEVSNRERLKEFIRDEIASAVEAREREISDGVSILYESEKPHCDGGCCAATDAWNQCLDDVKSIINPSKE